MIISGEAIGDDGLLAGVTVTAKNTSTGATKSTATGSNGTFSLDLDDGTYDLTATKSGYSGDSISGVQVGTFFNLDDFEFNLTALPVPDDPVPPDPDDPV